MNKATESSLCEGRTEVMGIREVIFLRISMRDISNKQVNLSPKWDGPHSAKGRNRVFVVTLEVEKFVFSTLS